MVVGSLLEESSPGSEIHSRVWNDVIDEAEFNDPRPFTAVIGFEWTSVPKGNNLYRNVQMAWCLGSKSGSVQIVASSEAPIVLAQFAAASRRLWGILTTEILLVVIGAAAIALGLTLGVSHLGDWLIGFVGS